MTRHGTLGSPKSGLFQLGLFGHFYERRSSGVIRASFTAFQSPQRTSTSSPSKMLDAVEALELEAACSPSYPRPHRSSFLSNMQTFVQRPPEGRRSTRWYHLVSKRRPPHCHYGSCVHTGACASACNLRTLHVLKVGRVPMDL